MCQPKAGSRLSLYSATSSNARRSIGESNRGHKVIVGAGWRVVVTILALNCMHMQAVVQVTQVITKTAVLQQQQFAISLLGGMQLLKQLQTTSLSITTFQ